MLLSGSATRFLLLLLCYLVSLNSLPLCATLTGKATRIPPQVKKRPPTLHYVRCDMVALHNP